MTPPLQLPPPAGARVDLLVVAGEHSGDEHGARMVRELRASQPGLVVAALGGPALAAAGAQLLHDLTASSVVGLVEVLKSYTYFRALFHALLRWIEAHRPRVVCLVDYPGFNLRLAAALRARPLGQGRREPQGALLHQPPDLGLEGAAALHHGARPRRAGGHLPV